MKSSLISSGLRQARLPYAIVLAALAIALALASQPAQTAGAQTRATLTPSNITATGVTLRITDHTGIWYYKQTAPHAGSCALGGVLADPTEDVTGLTAGTVYTFKAYSSATCPGNKELTDNSTDADFTTVGVSVRNLDASDGSGDGHFHIGNASGYVERWATRFRPGFHRGGYNLQSVTANFKSKQGSPGAIEVTIRGDSNGKPDDSDVRATLSGSNPNAEGTYIYTCDSSNSNNDCYLTPGAYYHLVVEQATNNVAVNNYYRWRAVENNHETNTPGGSGWTIADGPHQWRSNDTDWKNTTTPNHSGRFRVSATKFPALTASSVTAASATLTLSGDGIPSTWYYKQIAPSGVNPCRTVTSGTTVDLTLTSQKSYTFKAYSDSVCNTELTNDATDADFTTFALVASDITATSATLTLAGYTGAWRYKQTAPRAGACSSAVSGTTANLTNLTAGTPYTFKAYSDSGCATEITATATDAEFNTVGVSVNNLAVNDGDGSFSRIGRRSNGDVENGRPDSPREPIRADIRCKALPAVSTIGKATRTSAFSQRYTTTTATANPPPPSKPS